MDTDTDLTKIREEFIEKIGIIAQAEGMPRISGRLFALLVFEGRRYSFSELAKQLEVSRGSISAVARLLEDRGLIKRVANPGDRQDYFQLGDAPYMTLLQGAAQNARRSKHEIETTIAQLPAAQQDLAARLQAYAGFYDAIDESMSVAADRLDTKE
ncbi:GbsR/MarR family transcriptional regulator [Thioclava sp.]|uniref:GbsR/MarR family transcriptional regulator n=1 Tax=Thioclava sp. TaxID=1933450 RepID=UPI003AA83FF6